MTRGWDFDITYILWSYYQPNENLFSEEMEEKELAEVWKSLIYDYLKKHAPHSDAEEYRIRVRKIY